MATVETWRRRMRPVLSAFYGLAGVLHLALPKPFLSITPSWVPYPEAVILLTGLCEITGALGLLFPALRKSAAIGLALYAVCVFPANIKHALDSLGATDHSAWVWGYHVPRLALQPFLVWLALFAGGILLWPFQNRR